MNEALSNLTTRNIGLNIGLYLRSPGDYHGYRSGAGGDRTGKGGLLI